ncbi:MAG: DNA topoisomerase 3 [Synergistaceae bacterium]|nr:DNA topoisomerase 3 [Synergistaceae bacterium]
MRLFIAEKPSLARSIAAVLSKPQGNNKLYIQAGDDIVAWAAGHLLEQAMPEFYDEKYKRWNIADLPIFPEVWKMLVKKESKDLFDNLKKLLKKADVVVNAGDCDREGQLLIDEILDFCGYKGEILRILISDTNPEAVKKALDNLKPDSDFHGDRDAALARSRADWLHGMNLTRLYTKLAEKNGYNGKPLRIGRVKTPVTALVVRRDEAIEAFVPKPFWAIKANIQVKDGSFNATWKPNDKQQGLDEEKRLVDKSIAENLISRLKGKPANITKYESKKQSSKPPVGLSLPKLQMIASKKFDLSPAKTLEICQKLYEQGILTYPRSDCEFLPDAHQDDAEKVFAVIEKLSPAKIPQTVDKKRKTPVFNSKKVEEHHAIIPSASCKISKQLEKDEALVFELVARRYISFFMPDFEFLQVNINANIDGELFTASGRHILNEGWKSIEKDLQDKDDEKDNNDDNSSAPLPETFEGENGSCNDIKLLEKKTKAPTNFTEATLLKAMNEVYRYVKDSEIKKILKETDGIGTAATQATILKELIDSGMLIKKGKNLISSQASRSLIHALPEKITLPDLTAIWETYFRKIKNSEMSIDEVIRYIEEAIRENINSAQPITVQSTKTENSQKSYGKKSSQKSNVTCPRCGAPMFLRNGKNGQFWGCSNYPECKMTANDNNGKPIFKK